MEEKRWGKRPWGKAIPVKDEASLDVLIVEPGEEVPLHYHQETTEVHVMLNGEEKGKVNVFYPGEEHSYENNSEQALKMLCLCIPPFNPKDKIEVRE